ncbi:MAG: aldehyde dehydrogenase family protein [Mycobacterium sp.]|nr:aldehyde dehydrogenase family protein [Mycobacterium sp.]
MTTAPIVEPGGQTLTARDVGTGDVIAEFPAMDEAAAAAIVARARTGQSRWNSAGFGVRRAALQAWAALIVARSERFVDLIHQETGKPTDDAYMELAIAVEHIRWAATHAQRVLRRRRVSAGMLLPNFSASIDYEPFGVIGVISPWNYPLFAPVAHLASALAAGNTVVLKPSEYTSAVGAALVDAFVDANPGQPADVLALVTGGAAAGAGLISGGVDKVGFTGSPKTGRAILRACADTLTPAVMECGGKDAMIVAADADIKAAADAAAWGGYSNAGQTCVGVERIYVHQDVSEQFTAALVHRLRGVTVGATTKATYGPMTVPAQTDIVCDHVADAVARGTQLPLGGLERIVGHNIEPIVVLEADEDSKAVQEETFGPMVTVRTVPDLDEAVRLANNSKFGLGASVFSRSDGQRLAARLKCGMVSINSVLGFVSIPALPFGGIGDSGFGRIHGAEGLREYSRTKSVAHKRFSPPGLNGMLLQRNPVTVPMLRAMTTARFRRPKAHVR